MMLELSAITMPMQNGMEVQRTGLLLSYLSKLSAGLRGIGVKRELERAHSWGMAAAKNGEH